MHYNPLVETWTLGLELGLPVELVKVAQRAMEQTMLGDSVRDIKYQRVSKLKSQQAFTEELTNAGVNCFFETLHPISFWQT